MKKCMRVIMLSLLLSIQAVFGVNASEGQQNVEKNVLNNSEDKRYIFIDKNTISISNKEVFDFQEITFSFQLENSQYIFDGDSTAMYHVEKDGNEGTIYIPITYDSVKNTYTGKKILAGGYEWYDGDIEYNLSAISLWTKEDDDHYMIVNGEGSSFDYNSGFQDFGDSFSFLYKYGCKKVEDGWYLEDGYWYYYENGVKVTGWKNIGDSWYYMYEDGKMAFDTWVGEDYVDANGVWIQAWKPAKWIQNGSKYWYRNEDGSYPANCWKEMEGIWYYFDVYGYRVTSWLADGNTWYYMDADGKMLTGKHKIGNSTYLFAGNGAMVTGWIAEDGNWYYYTGSGAMATGWLADGNTWYYMDTDGKMLTGKQRIGNSTYYFDGSGAMITGWSKEGESWYYYNGSGAMVTSWLGDGGAWYYFDLKDGSMYAKQWLNDTYYLTGSGAMATGWLSVDGTYYYFTGSGTKVCNQWVGDYYLKADGSMAVNERVDNDRYYVDSTGKWVPGK